MRIALLAPLLAALAAAACADRSAAPAPVPGLVPYRLDAPDAVFELPPRLREISGLTVLPNGRLGAVEDETGTIYEVDPASGRVTAELAFGDDGDYEGIEAGPEAVWVLRSDGDLYRVARADSAADGGVEVRKVETRLRSRNDTEGLAYDAAGGRLLIACKEDPGDGLKGVRAVYAFDLATEEVSEEPVALLDRRQVDTRANFRPSALAVDPRTGRWFVLSSVRKALAVLDPDGALRAVVPLPARLFPQPEGIAFAPDGTLYISNEGPAGAATLLRFSPTDA